MPSVGAIGGGGCGVVREPEGVAARLVGGLCADGAEACGAEGRSREGAGALPGGEGKLFVCPLSRCTGSLLSASEVELIPVRGDGVPVETAGLFASAGTDGECVPKVRSEPDSRACEDCERP